MEICSFILSLVIVGAYEIRPGIMYVEFLENDTVQELYVYTDDYLSCWDNGVPLRESGPAIGGGTSTPSDSWLAFNMENKRYKQRRIAKEIEDTVYAYHVYPHMAMVPDYFVRYWDLCEAICDYFDIPFDKPTLSKIDKKETND